MKEFDKIENYLWDRMSEDEKKAFEEQIKSDPDLALAIEKQRMANAAIELLHKEKWRNKIKSWT